MVMDAKIEYLKMIQNIITRMSNYGFLLKGWGITLFSAVLALSIWTDKGDFFVIGLFPVLIFWGLDSFFLRTKHKVRELYNYAAQISEERIDFNLTPTKEMSEKVGSILKIGISPTLLWFWGTLLIALVLGTAILDKTSFRESFFFLLY